MEPPDINSSGQTIPFTICMAILVNFVNLRHLEWPKREQQGEFVQIRFA